MTPQYTLLQMKSLNDGSSSPTYSTIFLLIHGPTLLSINVCRKTSISNSNIQGGHQSTGIFPGLIAADAVSNQLPMNGPLTLWDTSRYAQSHQLMLCETNSVSEYLGILFSKSQYTTCTGVHYLESQAPTIPDQSAPT